VGGRTEWPVIERPPALLAAIAIVVGNVEDPAGKCRAVTTRQMIYGEAVAAGAELEGPFRGSTTPARRPARPNQDRAGRRPSRPHYLAHHRHTRQDPARRGEPCSDANIGHGDERSPGRF